MDSKFVPAYNKNGRWIFCNKLLTMNESESWLKQENVKEQTTIIPYNCEVCPDWMRNMYIRYQLMNIFYPKSKEY